ncbi:sigma-54-dependent Fis family transcriptional regulator [Nitratidesulfovibrio termitidis]|uniref:sigma-54-dependent Fis family transcriptional regulator n=1 Tax=Nitratidesulfovibrio termitidis TaxID=42252 RepID=UPI000429B36B|nr:sigma 54-interacting transcriptional regulator [Nitratidesulfovibrio termitidis]
MRPAPFMEPTDGVEVCSGLARGVASPGGDGPGGVGSDAFDATGSDADAAGVAYLSRVPSISAPVRPMTCEKKHSDEARTCGGGVCRGGIVPLLHEIGRMLSGPEDFCAALDRILGYMHSEMGVRRGMISLHHRESGRIFVHRSIGLTPEEQERGVYNLGEGITGRVVETAQPIIVPRIGDEPAFLNRTRSLSGGPDLELSFMCVPILRGSKVLGTISAERLYEDRRFLDRHVDVLTVMSHMLAHAVELYLVEKVDLARWEQRTRRLVDRLKERFHPASIIGASAPMREVYALMRKVSQTRTTVLLLGESGVGKEMIANALHYDGPNPEGPLVKFNCAALPENLVESELFGHERGAFTGAVQTRRGRFEDADGGTIFLDEVGELSPAMQAKLLRVLQERRFERVGGNQSITVNIRIIAATNRNLQDMVAQGTFREDLYYRFNVFPIMVPPLRERGSDIVTLAEHFMAHYARETEKNVASIATSALNMLVQHDWPGNVRELENVIHRAVILTEDDTIHAHDLPLSLQADMVPDTGAPCGLEARLACVEYEMLVEALRAHRGNTTEAARALGLTRRIMGLRMKRFKLTYQQFRKGEGATQG